MKRNFFHCPKYKLLNDSKLVNGYFWARIALAPRSCKTMEISQMWFFSKVWDWKKEFASRPVQETDLQVLGSQEGSVVGFFKAEKQGCKIFVGHLMIFSKSSRNQNLHEKMGLKKKAKMLRLPKNFLAWSCKNLFLQLRKPGLVWGLPSGQPSRGLARPGVSSWGQPRGRGSVRGVSLGSQSPCPHWAT